MRKKPMHVERFPDGTDRLTPEELAWARRLNRVLQECPSGRIGMYTIGDANLTLYDASKFVDTTTVSSRGCRDDVCMMVESQGIGLGTVYSSVPIEGTAG